MIKANKIIERNILRKAQLYEIELKIDSNYFINKIEDSLKEKNLNYATNVKGKMTGWNAFNDDKNFLSALDKGIKEVSKIVTWGKKKSLQSAWGIKIEEGDFTARHNHSACALSGILYLNNVNQTLEFPDLGISVEPKEGSFLVFTPWLDHYTEISESAEPKYAIAFNFEDFKHKTWD
tara:strand:- start:7347 stop:7880 length:534 start_codon:yes stop_codon:yes gene_type:complete